MNHLPSTHHGGAITEWVHASALKTQVVKGYNLSPILDAHPIARGNYPIHKSFCEDMKLNTTIHKRKCSCVASHSLRLLTNDDMGLQFSDVSESFQIVAISLNDCIGRCKYIPRLIYVKFTETRSDYSFLSPFVIAEKKITSMPLEEPTCFCGLNFKQVYGEAKTTHANAQTSISCKF